jgi:hypothetical protein
MYKPIKSFFINVCPETFGNDKIEYREILENSSRIIFMAGPLGEIVIYVDNS